MSKCKDDWLRYVLYSLVKDCEKQGDLLRNNLAFVTFNYDVSLENRIFRGLESNERIPNEDKIEFYNRKNLVSHVYGSVRRNGFENTQFGDFFLLDTSFGSNDSPKAKNAKICLDKAWSAAQSIFTIPQKKSANEDVLKIAKETISRAQTVYILGYGFDTTNSELINLKDLAVSSAESPAIHREVYFTNYGNSNRVNKSAGLLLVDDGNIFLESFMAPMTLTQGSYCEKSTKNVYDALAYDF
uniref:SIR2-like domain-containing protein n=1 Tax=candidate division WWE3 bacterium TaxID=2053526 RepID=A0A7C4XHP2_UNCKA